MKHASGYRIWFSLLFLGCVWLIASDFEQKPREDVTVTAVEVPVRVLLKNEAVKGLTREDFEVFENGIKQSISGFEVISRKITRPIDTTPPTIFQKPKPRLFILIFNIFDYTDAVDQAIDYFFKTIFGAGDQIVILTENRLLSIAPWRTLDDVKTDVKETLKKYKLISMRNIHKAYLGLKEECDRLLNIIELDKKIGQSSSLGDPVFMISRFYDQCQRIWTAYRNQFLLPDMGLYQALLKRIKPVEADKWAICFQQRDLFPVLIDQGRLGKSIDIAIELMVDTEGQAMARMLRDKQRQLEESLEISKNFPAERLRNLFMEAGITFHLILMKSLRTLGYDEDLNLQEVAQDYEACLRDISRSTGGYLTFSNQALDALKAAAAKEDYHYLIAYQSRAPLEKRGKDIEVQVHVPGARVYNLKYLQNLGSPVIAISDVQAGHKVLKFNLKNYTRINTNRGERGVAEVSVTLFDDKSEKVFSESKALDLAEKETHITLNFDKIKSGVYFLIIEAQDKITNEKDVFSRIIEL
jgi:hypothetical protein